MKKQTDYRALFCMGITFIGAGVVFMTSVNSVVGSGLLGLGAVFLVIGGKNKDK